MTSKTKNKLIIKKTLKPKFLRILTTIFFVAFLFNIPLYVASAAATRQWGTDDDGVTVTNGSGNRNIQKLIRASDGNFIVAWYDRRAAPNSIYLQKYDTSGNEQWTANGELGSGTIGLSGGLYNIIPDENGGAIYAWDSIGTNLKVQNIDSTGTVQWGVDGFTADASIGTTTPAILSDNSGGAYIAYKNSTSDMYMTYVDSTGALDANWDPPIAIEATANNEANAQLIAAGTNDVIIKYDQTVGNIDIRIEKIAINTYSTYTPGDTVWSATINEASGLAGSVAVSDGSDGIIVAYTLSNDIYAQRYDSTGTAQWGSGLVISNASGSQFSPKIISDSAGGAIISWNDTGGADREIYAQRVNSSGVVQWTANGTPVSDTTDGVDQDYNALTTNGGDGAIISFNENSGAPTQHILAQHINGSGTKMWTSGGFFVETADVFGQEDLVPEIIGDGYGGAFIVWERDDTGIDLNGQFVSDTTAYTGGMCASANTSSEICGVQDVSSYVLTFTEIPDSFDFAQITAGATQYVCQNTSELASPANTCSDNTTPDPPGLDDRLMVFDDRGSGGLEVQIQVDGTFSNGSDTIPLTNLYIVTTIDETDPNKEAGINYTTFTGTKGITSQIDVKQTTPEFDDISDPTTYTALSTYSQFGGSPLVLMDGQLSSASGREGYMSLFANFMLKVDATQAEGSYSLILTYDLLDNTT